MHRIFWVLMVPASLGLMIPVARAAVRAMLWLALQSGAAQADVMPMLRLSGGVIYLFGVLAIAVYSVDKALD